MGATSHLQFIAVAAVASPQPPQVSVGARTLDIGAGFRHLWQAPDGKAAIAIGGLMFLLFPLLFIPPLIAIGWVINYSRAVARGEPALPRWRFAYAWDGLRFVLIGIIYSIPLYIVLIPFYIAFFDQFSTIESGGMPDFSFFGAQIAIAGVSSLYGLALAAIQPAYQAVFASTDSVFDCLRPSMLKQAIRPFGWGYLLAPVMVFAAGFVAAFGIILCCVGYVFTGFYAQAITAHYSGQIAAGLPSVRPPKT